MPDGQDDDEARLLLNAQDGNVEAYGQLYECHVQNVHRFLAAHLNDRMDAEDLTADVFYRAWRALPEYDHRGVPFLAYLLRIARNILVDHYRRTSQVRNVALDTVEVVLPHAATEPAEVVLAHLEHQHLRHVIDRLRPDYRTVLVLRFLNDLSPQDTAKVMGRSAGAVRVLQHRALAALRELLADE
jgi:RNA polymerase sigma-70 factor, ECF subfamily